MKKHALSVVVASFALLSACSGEPEAAVESAGAEASEAVESPDTDATDEATEPATDDASEPASGGSTVLIGAVGTEENPEDFVISLTTEDGEEVTDLPAGDYTIRVSDPAATHNFHLLGGSVDESTTVPGTEDAVFEVTLEPGEYTYKCDPHPPMTGSFTVS